MFKNLSPTRSSSATASAKSSTSNQILLSTSINNLCDMFELAQKSSNSKYIAENIARNFSSKQKRNQLKALIDDVAKQNDLYLSSSSSSSASSSSNNIESKLESSPFRLKDCLTNNSTNKFNRLTATDNFCIETFAQSNDNNNKTIQDESDSQTRSTSCKININEYDDDDDEQLNESNKNKLNQNKNRKTLMKILSSPSNMNQTNRNLPVLFLTDNKIEQQKTKQNVESNKPISQELDIYQFRNTHKNVEADKKNDCLSSNQNELNSIFMPLNNNNNMNELNAMTSLNSNEKTTNSNNDNNSGIFFLIEDYNETNDEHESSKNNEFNKEIDNFSNKNNKKNENNENNLLIEKLMEINKLHESLTKMDDDNKSINNSGKSNKLNTFRKVTSIDSNLDSYMPTRMDTTNKVIDQKTKTSSFNDLNKFFIKRNRYSLSSLSNGLSQQQLSTNLIDHDRHTVDIINNKHSNNNSNTTVKKLKEIVDLVHLNDEKSSLMINDDDKNNKLNELKILDFDSSSSFSSPLDKDDLNKRKINQTSNELNEKLSKSLIKLSENLNSADFNSNISNLNEQSDESINQKLFFDKLNKKEHLLSNNMNRNMKILQNCLINNVINKNGLNGSTNGLNKINEKCWIKDKEKIQIDETKNDKHDDLSSFKLINGPNNLPHKIPGKLAKIFACLPSDNIINKKTCETTTNSNKESIDATTSVNSSSLNISDTSTKEMQVSSPIVKRLNLYCNGGVPFLNSKPIEVGLDNDEEIFDDSDQQCKLSEEEKLNKNLNKINEQLEKEKKENEESDNDDSNENNSNEDNGAADDDDGDNCDTNDDSNQDSNEKANSKSKCLKLDKILIRTSNEEPNDYIRGKGRGKYVCIKCGIRTKKPSMLRKHMRTHANLRPYICCWCKISFKTKGNLVKHMKTRAHVKKCIDMGLNANDEEITKVTSRNIDSNVLNRQLEIDKSIRVSKIAEPFDLNN